MTAPRVTVTIDELVVDRGEDVEAAVRAELEVLPVDAQHVSAAVAAAVAAAAEAKVAS